jgi:hypothetical protein
VRIEIEVRDTGIFLAGTDTPVFCHLFAGCDELATVMHDAGPLGMVPGCDRCHNTLSDR